MNRLSQSFTGEPSEPTPLPDDTPFAVESRNEAAERLLSDPSVLLMFSGPEIIGLNEGELELHLEAVAAAERRATVELATAIVNDIPEYADGYNTCWFCSYASHEGDGHAPDCAWQKARAILDEEAARA